MPKIFTIIITYNAMKWAEKCLNSIKQSSVPLHAIVIDNGSTDGTQEFIKSRFSEVEFIQSHENLGFGKANNLGIEMAYKKGADFFYLMNQDAWLYEDTIEKLLSFYNSYDSKEEIGILSPIHLDGTEKNIEIFVEKYLANNAVKNRIFTDFFLNNKKTAYELDFINAAHWFLPKKIVEIIGGFNPYFFHYGEDNEYVNRLIYKKKKIFLVKNCFAVHDGIQDLAKIDYAKYIDTTIETKIVNPSIKNSLEQEKKSLRQGIMKNYLLRDIYEAKKLKIIYKRILKNSSELSRVKEIIMSKEHPFLDI